MNTLFNKVLDENENCFFYFYLKTSGTCWPTQYIYNHGHTWSEYRKNHLNQRLGKSGAGDGTRVRLGEPVEADGGGEQSLEDRGWEGTTDRAHSGLEGAPGCTEAFILERSRNKWGGGGNLGEV